MTPDETDFDRLSWHDNLIYGLRIDAPDPDCGDWRSDLVLDIDHIVEWLPQAAAGGNAPAGEARFLVAPATLVFHGARDLRIRLDPVMAGAGLNEWAIDRVTREPAGPASGAAGAPPLFRWRIALNLPAGGEIGFDATGFSQTLRADPVGVFEQRLPPGGRPPLPPREGA